MRRLDVFISIDTPDRLAQPRATLALHHGLRSKVMTKARIVSKRAITNISEMRREFLSR
jgi:hypothetical protein